MQEPAAGARLPAHPHEQEDLIELRVYTGADGDFTLYEDDGITYAYEKGQFATITLHWNEGTRTLTLGERKGAYPGMRRTRRFGIVFVRKWRGLGIEQTFAPTEILYDGRPFETKLTETFPGSS
jgi:alpha-D-xyloside xylohydrolase